MCDIKVKKNPSAVYIVFFLTVLFIFLPIAAHAGEELTVIVTSNLEGRFSLEESDQDNKDPLLILAQAMLVERKKGKVDLYLDLGNAFYPGPLSKYSFGSAMMDYFNYFSCDLTLVSSKDLRIGVDNLQFLGAGKKTRLLSSNIERDGKPLFNPYHVYTTSRGAPVAFVGISAKKILFDIAEKNLYKIKLEKDEKAVPEVLKQIAPAGAKYVIALSGQNLKDTIEFLNNNKQISMALCGGDDTGSLFSGTASRVDLADGRSILVLPKSGGFYVLDLLLDAGVHVTDVRRIESSAQKTDSDAYRQFVSRLTLWKRKYSEEEDKVICSCDGGEYRIDDTKFSFLLRDRYNSEISITAKGTIVDTVFNGDIRQSDLLKIVNNDYNIFVYTLTGADLKQLSGAGDDLSINGYTNEKIQGYPAESARKYRIASTQLAFERAEQLLGREIAYRNQWENVTDVMLNDLRGEKSLFRDDYDYLERRFRSTIDFYFSNYFNNSVVKTKEGGDIPPGMPSASYRQWGLENEIDINVYNRYHQFLLTPYVDYERYDQSYLRNLLRGTFTYFYNMSDLFKPYYKSQAETVVDKVDQLRPVVIRDTAGMKLTTGILTLMAGTGIEKKVHDPVIDTIFGVEAIARLKFPFWKYFSYTLSLDSFFAADRFQKREKLAHLDMTNGISVRLNSFLGVSLKHRWFYINSKDYGERYSDSQVVTSLDFRTDFKVW